MMQSHLIADASPNALGFGVALAMGLLIGLERERNKRAGPILIVEPLLGWLQVSYGGVRIILPVLGWHLSALVQPAPQSEELAGEVHALIGNVFYGVIALHVLAALWHHFIRRDNTLKRML